MSEKTFRILGEETVRRLDLAGGDVDLEAENPYWTWDEIPPHPEPEKGCIQRGLCCRSSPGWFGPGEVEAAAGHLGMDADAFVRRFLVIDSIAIEGDDGESEVVHVFAPLKLARDGKPALPPASRADALYRALRGTCIFYDGHGCGIYEARPTECREYICTRAPADNPSHEAIARLWKASAAPQ